MASGITKRKGGTNCDLLNIVVYDIQGNFEMKTESDKFEHLDDWGFDVVKTKTCNTPEEILEERNNIIAIRDSLDISIDGIVLKQDIIVKSDLLRKRPEYQRAFKFETEQVITKLIDIEWSRNGYNYTPVAILEPVDLMGSIVKRASLANLDNMKKLDIHIGDDVLIHKAGEIIPQILKVVNEGSIRGEKLPPGLCEVCESELTVTGSKVYCPNPNCDSRKYHRLVKWLDKTGVKGFGPATLSYLFDEEFVKDITDLYIVNLDAVLNSTNLKKATKKAFDNLYKIKEMKLEAFVSGFDIEGIGEGVVKFAVDAGYDTLEELKEASVSNFMRIDGFSEGRAKLLYLAMDKLYDEMKELTSYVKIKEVSIMEEDKVADKLNGVSFCFTGKLEEMTRAEASDLAIKHGGTVKSSVSKGLDFLVTNSEDETSKMKKAKSLGTEIITESQFMRKLL